jgi:hypothetical protein
MSTAKVKIAIKIVCNLLICDFSFLTGDQTHDSHQRVTPSRAFETESDVLAVMNRVESMCARD